MDDYIPGQQATDRDAPDRLLSELSTLRTPAMALLLSSLLLILAPVLPDGFWTSLHGLVITVGWLVAVCWFLRAALYAVRETASIAHRIWW